MWVLFQFLRAKPLLKQLLTGHLWQICHCIFDISKTCYLNEIKGLPISVTILWFKGVAIHRVGECLQIYPFTVNDQMLELPMAFIQWYGSSLQIYLCHKSMNLWLRQKQKNLIWWSFSWNLCMTMSHEILQFHHGTMGSCCIIPQVLYNQWNIQCRIYLVLSLPYNNFSIIFVFATYATTTVIVVVVSGL